MIDEIETSPLKRAREKRKQMAENGIKIQIKNPIEKARDNPRSLRLAVNAMSAWGKTTTLVHENESGNAPLKVSVHCIR